MFEDRSKLKLPGFGPPCRLSSHHKPEGRIPIDHQHLSSQSAVWSTMFIGGSFITLTQAQIDKPLAGS